MRDLGILAVHYHEVQLGGGGRTLRDSCGRVLELLGRVCQPVSRKLVGFQRCADLRPFLLKTLLGSASRARRSVWRLGRQVDRLEQEPAQGQHREYAIFMPWTCERLGRAHSLAPIKMQTNECLRVLIQICIHIRAK